MAANQLTDRQQLVYDGFKAGLNAHEIAEQMGISVNGVYGHVKRLRASGVLESKSKRKRGKAKAKRRAPSSNGRRQGKGVENDVIVAVEKAHAAAKQRLDEIDGAVRDLEIEREAISTALS